MNDVVFKSEVLCDHDQLYMEGEVEVTLDKGDRWRIEKALDFGVQHPTASEIRFGHLADWPEGGEGDLNIDRVECSELSVEMLEGRLWQVRMTALDKYSETRVYSEAIPLELLGLA